ncbi:MAG: hypothetical protein ACOCTT_02045 [archaeon]
MTKHVLIQSEPPEKSKMREHPILPNPISEMPLEYGGTPEDLQIYREAKTGKLSTEKTIIDKIFKGLPITLKKQED